MAAKKNKTGRKAAGAAEKKRRQRSGGHSRGMWAGTISFGLVSVPVSLFPALRRPSMQMRILAPDGKPLQRRYVCPADGKVLDTDDLVRGYELDDGRYVVVPDEDLEAVAPEKSRDISLKQFVARDEIPPLHFERPYFLAPGAGSLQAYRLLAHVMESEARVGIARFVMREKEYLIAILAEDGLLVAETLRFQDEVRTPEEIGLPEPVRVPKQRVTEFERVIGRLREEEVDMRELEDRRAARWKDLLQTKRERRDSTVRSRSGSGDDPGRVIDLVSVFKQRMQDARADRTDGAQSGGLRELTKQELYERAQAAGIPGRSKMSRDELAKALTA